MEELHESIANTDAVFAVDDAILDDLKKRAIAGPRRRARIFLHRDASEAVQEMIVAACSDAAFSAHGHPGRESSFTMIEGELDLILFDDAGGVTDTIRMATPGQGLPFCLKLEAERFHTVAIRSEIAVFHETTAGPFVEGEASTVPEWAV